MTGGFLLFLTPPSYFDPQQSSFQSILAGTQFSLSFNRQSSFTQLFFQVSAREGQPELPQFKLREADGKGQDFLQSCKLLLRTLGQLSEEMVADRPVLPVFPHWPALSKQGWLFSPSSASNLFTCCFVLSWHHVENALSLCLSFSRYKRLIIFLLCFPRSCNALLISVCKCFQAPQREGAKEGLNIINSFILHAAEN